MMSASRRDAIGVIGLGAVVGALGMAEAANAAGPGASSPATGLLPAGAVALADLTERLAAAPLVQDRAHDPDRSGPVGSRGGGRGARLQAAAQAGVGHG